MLRKAIVLLNKEAFHPIRKRKRSPFRFDLERWSLKLQSVSDSGIFTVLKGNIKQMNPKFHSWLLRDKCVEWTAFQIWSECRGCGMKNIQKYSYHNFFKIWLIPAYDSAGPYKWGVRNQSSLTYSILKYSCFRHPAHWTQMLRRGTWEKKRKLCKLEVVALQSEVAA